MNALKSAAVVLLFATSAAAKGPSFADLISELTVPATVRPGEWVQVEARLDLEAFCARTEYFKGDRCMQIALETLRQPELRLSTAQWDNERAHAFGLVAPLVQVSEGRYRGAMQVLNCQQPGAYFVRSLETNPALENLRVEVESGLSCAADTAAPQIDEIDYSHQAPLGESAVVLVQAHDESSGVAQATAWVTRSQGGLERMVMPCASCGGAFACRFDVACTEPGTMKFYLHEVVDHAGRSHFAEGEQFIDCDAPSQARAPKLSCGPVEPLSAGPDPSVELVSSHEEPAGIEAAPSQNGPLATGCSLPSGDSGLVGWLALVVAATLFRRLR